jgi:hypothetical protein
MELASARNPNELLAWFSSFGSLNDLEAAVANEEGVNTYSCFRSVVLHYVLCDIATQPAKKLHTIS